jgi:hypothetical protein
VIRALSDYFRIPGDILGSVSLSSASEDADTGFFRFGAENICYGRCESGTATSVAGSRQFDASCAVVRNGTTLQVPFSFDEVIENLRCERYTKCMKPEAEALTASEPIRKIYYLLREFLPVSVRRHLQRTYFRDWKELPFPAWPVDFTVDSLHQAFLRLLMETSGVKKLPFIWFWPNGANSSLIITHDVETSAGRDFTSQLMDLDDSYGIKSSFQVIPERRYEVPDEYVREIKSRGFELNVHDLNHDGHLYQERTEFLRRAQLINTYLHRYESQGFRAGSMYRNQDWYDAFDFSYDMSVPNVAHLEPLRGGCCTVMPYFIGKVVELPLTMAQDYSLFHILRRYSIDLWKQQLALIQARNGMISFITHPDYLINKRARDIYASLLEYLRQMIVRDGMWAALPGDVNRWWRARSRMELVSRGNDWEIVGPEKEKARLAYAVLDGDRLIYELAGTSPRIPAAS